MEYLKEQLETQYRLNFDDTKEEDNPINLDVNADVVYIEVYFYRGPTHTGRWNVKSLNLKRFLNMAQ